jgi:hypothetical protein
LFPSERELRIEKELKVILSIWAEKANWLWFQILLKRLLDIGSR